MALNLVAQVISPPTESVQNGEILSKRLGDQPCQNTEVLVMLSGQAPAPPPSLINA